MRHIHAGKKGTPKSDPEPTEQNIAGRRKEVANTSSTGAACRRESSTMNVISMFVPPICTGQFSDSE